MISEILNLWTNAARNIISLAFRVIQLHSVSLIFQSVHLFDFINS